MNGSQMDLFGREKELELFHGLVRGNDKVVFISGVGGVGKTSLLNTSYKYLKEQFRDVKIVGPLELSDPFLRSVQAVMSQIAESIEEQTSEPVFELFQRELDIFTIAETRNLPPDRVVFFRKRLLDTFIECFNHLSDTSTSKIVVMFDTVEYIISNEFWSDLFTLIKQLRQKLIIISGRQEGIERAINEARQKISKSQTIHKKLRPLSLQNSQAVLESYGEDLPLSLKRNIFLLTEGLPILLVLAADRLRRGLELPKLLTNHPKEFRDQEIQALQPEFEASLVDFLLVPKNEVDILILWMGMIDKRFDIEILRYLTGKSLPKCRELITDIGKIRYVKQMGNSYKLHEDVASLIKEKVWKLIDPYREQQHALSQKLVEYYDIKINQMETGRAANQKLFSDSIQEHEPISTLLLRKSRINDILIMEYKFERVYYASLYDPEQAVIYFREAYDSHKDWLFRQGLISGLAFIEPHLDPKSRFEISIRRARIFTEKGMFADSEKELVSWLDTNEINPLLQIDLLSAIANLHFEQGKLPEALTWIDKAIALAEENVTEWYAKLLQTKGYFLRNMGHLREAITIYKEVLNHMSSEGSPRKLELANLMTNLGFALGLEGAWFEGLVWCEQALRIKREVGSLSEIASSLDVLGSVLWAKGDYESARKRYQQALDLVEMPNDSMLHARIYFGLGIADWFARDYISAKNNFETSIQISKDNGHDRLLPHALHNLGHIYKELGDLKKAILLFNEGYKLSKDYHDFFALTDSIVGFAEYYYELGEYEKIDPFNQEMQELENQGVTFPLFAGRMERILGEVAYIKGDLEAAKQLFSEALSKIAEHGGYGKYELREELLKVGRIIDQLPAPIAVRWCETIELKWHEKKIARGYDEMIAFVTAHKLMIKN